jgi:phosphomannomutase
MNNDNFVTIRRYHDSILANLVAAALHDAGIETLQLSNGSVLPTDEHEITVRSEDAEAAIEIIEQQENL